MLIVFDFDGTLADTFEAAQLVYEKLATENGFRQISPEEIPTLRELGVNDILKELDIPKRKVPALLLKGRAMLRETLDTLPLREGVADMILTLREKEIPLGILTSNSAENVTYFLDRHSLTDHFEFISSTSKLSGKHKHLRSIARTFSISTKDILYIGDEIRDIQASKKAGVRSAAVTWGFNSAQALQKENPDHLIHDPLDILGIEEF